MTTKVKNISPGPRGINARSGAVLLQPGQEADLDVSDAELKVARKTGWFEFDGEARKSQAPQETEEVDDFNDMTVPQLKEYLANKGIELDGDEKKADLVELAENTR